MPTFTKYKPKNEKELHGIIGKELDAIEEGLYLLRYEFSTGKGTPDFLCADSGGRLVIIEVKLTEDENVLFQALRYYSTIDKDRYLIFTIFPDKEIDPEPNPRIILIAERFSEDIKRLSTLILPDIELLEYTVLLGSGGNKGIFYHPVSLPIIDEPITKSNTIDDHRDYLRKDSLTPVFDKMRNEVISISKSIEEYSTQNYIGYKFNGKQIGWVATQRKSIDIGVHIIDEDREKLGYEKTRVENETDDYKDILVKLKRSFVNMGGKLRD